MIEAPKTRSIAIFACSVTIDYRSSALKTLFLSEVVPVNREGVRAGPQGATGAKRASKKSASYSTLAFILPLIFSLPLICKILQNVAVKKEYASTNSSHYSAINGQFEELIVTAWR